MKEQPTKLLRARPGPEKQPPKLNPFVAVKGIPYNPWSLCTPENRHAYLVTCGLGPAIAKVLTANLSQFDRERIIKKRRTHTYRDGRQLEIKYRTMHGTNSVIGAYIRLQNRRGVSVQIFDVQSFFQTSWTKLCRRYKSDDLAVIMERTRASLASVGITSYQQQWWLCSSLAAYIWKKLDINLGNVPALSAPKGPGNLQGYHVFGHTDHPVYSYDIRSAYLSVMAEFDALRPFTDYVWHARRELEQANDPAAHVLKLLATIMPGKFTSEHKGNKFHRPVLGQYIRQTVNRRLEEAMLITDKFEAPTHLNVFRYCVDGFIAFSDISRYLEIGDGLGQWKPIKRHEYLTIAKTNVWWTDREYKDGGYHVTEADLLNGLSNDPFSIRTSRTVFDWELLEERIEPITLRQSHQGLLCRRCWEGTDIDLHDRG